jgi:hypothetical protein
MSVTRGSLVSLLLWLLGAAVAVAQPVGPEFRVNTYTRDYQEKPSIASDASGNFVVVWQSSTQDGSGDGIFGQRYNRDGNPLGGEFRVNTYTTDSQSYPSITSDATGNFIVVWASLRQEEPFNWGIFGQRYASTGAPLGSEFRVNSHIAGQQTRPSVASDSAGNFVVVWDSLNQDGNLGGVFGQRYASTGAPLGGEFQINTYTWSHQVQPSVASDSAGNFVVAWESFDQYFAWAVFAQRYASTGVPLGAEFKVSDHTFFLDTQRWPSVGSDPAGNFVVVWQTLAGFYDIYAQRYSSTGAPRGGVFRVNTEFSEDQVHPSVETDAAGNFVVAWESFNQDGSGYGTFGQRYSSTGAPLGGEFQINTYTTSHQLQPSVAFDSAGDLVVAWNSWSQDGAGWGVFAQRFSAACEASVQVKGASQDVYTPGSPLPIRIHIAHKRPETVTVPWELSLIDPWGRVVAERVTPPHTFEPGDVVDVDLALPLPENLEEGTYTLRLGISGMAGTEGATTTFRVVAE